MQTITAVEANILNISEKFQLHYAFWGMLWTFLESLSFIPLMASEKKIFWFLFIFSQI